MDIDDWLEAAYEDRVNGGIDTDEQPEDDEDLDETPGIFAMWHGGTNYSSGVDWEHLEVFPTVEAAGDALRSRAVMGHHWEQAFTYADGRESRALTPCADEGAYMDIYFTDPRDSDDGVSKQLVLDENNDVKEEGGA